MLRISKLTDYATVILSYMAGHDIHCFAATELSGATGITQPTVSKLLKMLMKAKLVGSERGAKGGYYLARKPEQISVATVISAVEGPIALTECNLPDEHCQQSSICGIRSNWGLINQAVRRTLESITLTDMVASSVSPVEFKVPLGAMHARQSK